MEADVQVTSQGVPNDTAFYSQKAYFESQKDSPVGLNILGLWDALPKGAVTKIQNPIDIIVLDSTFVINKEVPYFDGRSFTTMKLVKGGSPQIPNNDPSPKSDNNCEAHGLGVSSMITSRINNKLAGAGITNNAHLYDIRVLTCGIGWMSDISNGLFWLSGVSFEGVKPYQGHPGIVNISAGAGETTGCSYFMQKSINAAIDAGFTIVAAAGNDGKDVAEFTPANCKGVITVGALDKTGKLASFSNFGSGVDVSAIGMDVYGLFDDKQIGGWGDGTSFSTPMISGGLSVIKQVTSLDDTRLKLALSLSSSVNSLGTDCQSGACGDGEPDFATTLNIAKMMVNNTLHTIEFALGRNDPCTQTWLLDNFGQSGKLCQMYRIRFNGGYYQAGQTYKLYSVKHGATWSPSEEYEEGVFKSGTVLLTNLDVITKDYGFKLCRNGICDSIVLLNSTKAQEAYRPIACKK